MTLQLRPSTLGEILDRTANLYRARFLVFLGIAMVPAGVVLACASAFFLLPALTVRTGEPRAAILAGAWMLVVALIGFPVAFAATALGYAAMSTAANQAYLGESFTIRGSYQDAWKRGWRYLGLFALEALLVGVAPMLIVFVFVIAAAAMRLAGPAMGGLGAGILVLVVAGLALYCIWMLLRICMAFPVSVAEQAGAWPSIQRAAALSKGTRGRIFVLYLLCAAVAWIASMVLSIPAFILISLIPQLGTPQHQQTLGMLMMLLMYGASFAAQALTKPVSGIALMVFYYDQRIRKEAFDIEYLMRQAGMIPEVAPQPQTAPSILAAGDMIATPTGENQA